MGTTHPHAYQDDYVNQTYWLTVYPLKDQNIDVGLSVGFGLMILNTSRLEGQKLEVITKYILL